MNKIKIIASIFLILTAFTFTSCENEPIDSAINLNDFNNNNNGNGNAVFKADFSGNTWNATSTHAVISGNQIILEGAKGNGEGFSFLVQASTTGTYPANTNLLAFTPAGSTYGYWSVNTSNPAENTGSFTITSIDTTNHILSGSFNYKGYWSDTNNTAILPIVFTNGVFQNIPYVTQDQTGNTFFAKVGGVEFVDVDILSSTITVGGHQYINIAGRNAALNSITVSVDNSLPLGTYPITGNITTDGVQGIYAFENNNYNAISGSVTITSKTATRIKGTFNFVTNGATTYTVTEGAFDVAY